MGRVLRQLINSYRTDPDSDFLNLKYQVRMKHDAELTRLIPDDVTNRDSLPTGMIRGPERAEIRQAYSLKRIDYSLRMARRMSESSRRVKRRK